MYSVLQERPARWRTCAIASFADKKQLKDWKIFADLYDDVPEMRLITSNELIVMV